MRKIHTNLSAQAEQTIYSFHSETITDLQDCIEKHDVVVVGMALNPYVISVKKSLKQHKISFIYKEYGGYFSAWKQRLAIKIWSGWPTFPQVFIRQTLIGGAADTRKALQNNQIQKLLSNE